MNSHTRYLPVVKYQTMYHLQTPLPPNLTSMKSRQIIAGIFYYAKSNFSQALMILGKCVEMFIKGLFIRELLGVRNGKKLG